MVGFWLGIHSKHNPVHFCNVSDCATMQQYVKPGTSKLCSVKMVLSLFSSLNMHSALSI